MENIKLNFIHLCDQAYIANGKVNIMGIFKDIYASQQPAIHPNMSLVFETLINDDKEHILEIKFKDPNNDDARKSVNINNVKVANVGDAFGYVLNVLNIELKKEGKYKIEIYADNKFLGETYFNFKVNQNIK